MSQRSQQVAEELRKIISMILLEDVNDPRMGFVTITRIELTDDLRYAKIHYSVLGSDEEKAATEVALKENMPVIKRLAVERINMKYAIELKFELDKSIEHSFKIDEILKKIRKKKMDGILLFNKPILWTSHDAVDFTRRRIGQRSVGHAGTLDPLATGLLVLLIGKATKLSSGFSVLDKEYAGTMTLGIRTDTQDLEGKILSEAAFDLVTEERVRSVFEDLCGTQRQSAPLYSAVRRKGRKSYEWARRGIAVEPSDKEITIKDFTLTGFAPPEIAFRLSCSKGTYVRTLCDEAGERLGCGATLSSLVRTRVGSFALESAMNEEKLARLSAHDIEKGLIREDLPRV